MHNKFIKIHNVHDGDVVGKVKTISGFAHPCLTDLNILVYSNDNMWYFQKAISRTSGAFWKVETHFGDENSLPNSEYTIIVINKHIEDKTPISELPSDSFKSKTVKVVRF